MLLPQQLRQPSYAECRSFAYERPRIENPRFFFTRKTRGSNSRVTELSLSVPLSLQEVWQNLSLRYHNKDSTGIFFRNTLLRGKDNTGNINIKVKQKARIFNLPLKILQLVFLPNMNHQALFLSRLFSPVQLAHSAIADWAKNGRMYVHSSGTYFVLTYVRVMKDCVALARHKTYMRNHAKKLLLQSLETPFFAGQTHLAHTCCRSYSNSSRSSRGS